MPSSAQPAATARTPLPIGEWTVDPAASRVAFKVKHMGVATVKGRFARFEGTLKVGEESARAFGSVDVASIDTDDPKRDENLRSPDLFDAERNHEISFSSTAIRALAEGTFEIVGDLAIGDVTRPIALAAKLQDGKSDPQGTSRFGLSASAQISRSDFELRFGGALASGNVVVADKVEILLEISAVKTAQPRIR